MRFSAIVTVVCLSIAALSASADAEAHIKKRTDIPAQDLAPALQTLAKDHNFQIIYVSEELSDKRSQGAIGVFTADEALKSLLRGTGLTYRYLDENTVTILHDPAGGPSGAPISMSLREEKTPAEADLGDSSLKPAPENARFGQLRLAQASPQGGQAAAAKSSAFDRNASHLVQPQDALDEIIVTANKRKENLQNVPISIVSLTSERLESSGVQSTDDLSAVVPGLTMESNFSGFAPHLRGVGQTSTQVGNENSVAITVDGVYIANLNGALLDLASVDSIEVDKGPQGTLFGRNATGGAIIITTKDPTQEFHGTGSLTYGNYNTVETSDYVTGGITPILAADLAVYASHQGDGYGRNLYTGSEVQRTDLNVSARSKWKLTPTDVDTITLALDYEQMNSSALGAFRSLDQYTVGVTPPYTFAGRPWDIDSGFDPFLHMKQGGGSLRVKHDFEFATFNSISAYRQTNVYQGFSFTPAPTPYERPIWDNPEREITQELQIGSLDSSTIKWVAGLYYFNDKASYDPFSVHGDALFPIQLQFFSTVTDESEAAYGQVTVPIRALGDTNVTVGLRYTMEQRGIIGETNIAQDPSLGGGLIASTDPADTSKDFDKLTWRFALDHRFSDQLMVYVSDNRGFQSGTFNSIPAGCAPNPTTCPGGQPLAVNPQVLDAYEVGFKGDFLDHRLRINTSAFYYDYSQLQVTSFSALGATLVNGAKAEIYGVDLDIAAKPTSNLTITAGVEGLHDRFVSFPNAQFYVPDPAAGGNNIQVGDAAGKKLPYTPDWTFTLAADYVAKTAHGNLDFNATYSYNSGWYAQQDNILGTPSYYMINSRVRWSLPDGKTRLILWGRNLADKEIPSFLAATANPGGSNEEILQPPRTYGLTLQRDF